ncbi:MAG: helix-turn-helix domain-containing protein [Verrucomicrobiota bacterium JB023]|nr:helix-turn-helix domain-containing protein [Verrucomicrobiota bacterium JB023]
MKPNIPHLLTLEEVASSLKTSVKTIRRRIQSGELPSFKEGGRILVFESDLLTYIAAKSQRTRIP